MHVGHPLRKVDAASRCLLLHPHALGAIMFPFGKPALPTNVTPQFKADLESHAILRVNGSESHLMCKAKTRPTGIVGILDIVNLLSYYNK